MQTQTEVPEIFGNVLPKKLFVHSGLKPRDSKALQAQACLIDRGQLVRLKNASFQVGTAAGVTSPRLRLASALGRKGSGGAARLFRPTSGGLGGVWSHAWENAPELLRLLFIAQSEISAHAASTPSLKSKAGSPCCAARSLPQWCCLALG